MADEDLVYEHPEPADRSRVLAVLAGDEVPAISTVLISIALHDDDGEWVERICWAMAEHHDPWVRGTAGLCLGHVARRFGAVQDRSWRVARQLCDDPAADSRPCDGLDDMRRFAGPEPAASTGAASGKRHPPTGANVSQTYRNFTHRDPPEDQAGM